MDDISEYLIINREDVKVFHYKNVLDLDEKPGYDMLGGTFSNRIVANDFIKKSFLKGWVLYNFGTSSEKEVEKGRPYSVLMFK